MRDGLWKWADFKTKMLGELERDDVHFGASICHSATTPSRMAFGGLDYYREVYQRLRGPLCPHSGDHLSDSGHQKALLAILLKVIVVPVGQNCRHYVPVPDVVAFSFPDF